MAMMPFNQDPWKYPTSSSSEKSISASGEQESSSLSEINETGHKQELDRNFSLFSICSVGIVTGNTWASLGGRIVVGLYNGGPPGMIYEFIAVSIFYWLIAVSLAELASSMPSSAGVYYWASITPGPRYASMASILSNISVGMYGVYHPEYVPERWHIFVGYLIATWFCCCIVLFFNRVLPTINNIGLFLILGGVFITILVCAIMPSMTDSGHASSSFVWSEWNNQAGYTSDGFVFLAGMLNGAYAMGTPDCVSHLAEEIPNPKRNIPLAIASQMVIGFITALVYMIAIFYAISNLDDVFAAPVSPLAIIYYQATSSNVGSIGLLLAVFLPIFCTTIGTYITSGRTLWTLARDDATPFPSILGRVSPRFKNPFNATLACGGISTVLGCIYIGSSTAFNAFVGSFVVLSTLSYLAAIFPFILTRRFDPARTNGPVPGPYQMSSVVGYAVNIASCLYIAIFVVIYCFPYSWPVTSANMNYSCLITGGLTAFMGGWWLWRGKRYVGPQMLVHE